MRTNVLRDGDLRFLAWIYAAAAVINAALAGLEFSVHGRVSGIAAAIWCLICILDVVVSMRRIRERRLWRDTRKLFEKRP
jgi:hypothetical protein